MVRNALKGPGFSQGVNSLKWGIKAGRGYVSTPPSLRAFYFDFMMTGTQIKVEDLRYLQKGKKGEEATAL